MRRSFRVLFLLVFAVFALALTACGGGSSKDVQETIDTAFSTPIKSAKVNLDVSLKLDGIKELNGPIKLSVTGPYESGGGVTIPKVDFDIAASAAGQNFSAGFISTGTNAFVSFQGQNYEVGREAVAQINQQIRQANGQKKQSGLGQFGIDPKNWLTDEKDEGSEDVQGVETTHVSSALDVSAFIQDINKLIAKAGGSLPGGASAAQLTPEQQKQIEDVIENPRFDVYVGKDDNTIRRLSADVEFSVPENQQAQLGGLKGGTLSFSIEFADVGKPQTITAPTSAKPLSELTQQLGGLGSLLGGAAGSGSGGSGSAGTGTGSTGSGTSGSGPSAAALKAYSKCLQKADPSKPAELQKCADLLK